MANDDFLTELPFEEAIDFQEGPGILAKDFRDTGVPLIRLSGLTEGVPVLTGCNYLDEDMVNKKWSHFRVKKGDILLSTSATLGRIAIVDAQAEGAIPYTGIIRMRPKNKKVLPEFIPFLLASRHFQLQCEAMGVGSVIRHFGPSHLRQMTVRLPTLTHQRAIAHILGSLDDKIELNRRMNETLEQMARAIFKSWFVDFDPVRAKAEGRDTGLPDEIAELFPDGFEQTEMGEVPRGWEVKSLDQIAEYLNGLACQKYPPKEGVEALPVVKIRELRQGVTDNTDLATSNVPSNYIVQDGDVLFSWSGSLLIDIWTQGRAILNQHLFKVSSDSYPKWFYFYWTDYHLEEFKRIAAYKATTMGHIKRHHLSDAKVFVPNNNLMRFADEQINPLFELRIKNKLEGRKLTEIRDTLLPKLISGEVRVPDVERFIEEADI